MKHKIMISIIANKDRCNIEFERLVNKKMLKLIDNGFIICSVKLKKDKFNKDIGAIIKYKKKVSEE